MKRSYEAVVEQFDLSSLSVCQNDRNEIAILLEKDFDGTMLLGTWKRQTKGKPYKVYVSQRLVDLYDRILNSLAEYHYDVLDYVPEEAMEHIKQLVTLMTQKHEQYSSGSGHHSSSSESSGLELGEIEGWGKSFS